MTPIRNRLSRVFLKGRQKIAGLQVTDNRLTLVMKRPREGLKPSRLLIACSLALLDPECRALEMDKHSLHEDGDHLLPASVGITHSLFSSEHFQQGWKSSGFPGHSQSFFVLGMLANLRAYDSLELKTNTGPS